MNTSETKSCRILPHIADNKFVFFNTDYCPMGQRGWMTLLEKKVDFKYFEINPMDSTSEETKCFWEVSPRRTVPAGIHHGKNIHDSVPFCKYVDEMFPESSLCPVAPYQRWRARVLIREINEEFVPLFYKVLFEQDASKWENFKKLMMEALECFDNELAHSGGPWLMGEQFTIVDISLLTFVEHMQALIPHYRNWDPLSNYEHLKKWMERGFERESFKTTASDRTPESIAVQPFKSRKRVDYLREVFEANIISSKIGDIYWYLGEALPPDIPCATGLDEIQSNVEQLELTDQKFRTATEPQSIPVKVAAV